MRSETVRGLHTDEIFDGDAAGVSVPVTRSSDYPFFHPKTFLTYSLKGGVPLTSVSGALIFRP